MSSADGSANPRDWPTRRLLDLVELPQGQVDPRSHPYCRWPLIAPDYVESATGRLLNPPTAEDQRAISGKYIVRSSDIVLSKIRPALRKVVRVKEDALCSADMYPLRPGLEIDSGFLFWVLLGSDFSSFAESRAGRSGIPKINRSELREYKFALPPLHEQRRIAEVLDTADNLIRAEQDQLNKLRAVRQGILRSKLDLDGLDARSWRHRLSESLISIEVGNSPDLQDTRAEDGEWGVLKVSAIRLDGLDSSENKAVHDPRLINSDLEIRDGDLLITRANTVSLVGIACIARNPPPRLMLCDKTLRLVVNPHIAIPEFLCLALGLDEVRSQIRVAATGTSGSMKNISQMSVRQLVIPLPPLSDQQLLIEVTATCDAQARNTHHRLGKLRMIKNGLMDDLLTGRFRVGELST
jgi:type I restriction enzyme S subunit